MARAHHPPRQRLWLGWGSVNGVATSCHDTLSMLTWTELASKTSPPCWRRASQNLLAAVNGLRARHLSSISCTARRHALGQAICRFGIWASIYGSRTPAQSRVAGSPTLRQSHCFLARSTGSTGEISSSALRTMKQALPRTYSMSRQIRLIWAGCEPSSELEMFNKTPLNTTMPLTAARLFRSTIASCRPRGQFSIFILNSLHR